MFGFRIRFGFRLIQATLLIDFLKVPVNVRNQRRDGLVNSSEAGLQLLELLTLRPGGDIAETVLGGLDAVILAYGIGHAFGLDLFSTPVFFDRLLIPVRPGFRLEPVIIMQLAVADLMDDSSHGLYLAHAGPNGDPLLVGAEIAIRRDGHVFKLDGNRRGPA